MHKMLIQEIKFLLIFEIIMVLIKFKNIIKRILFQFSVISVMPCQCNKCSAA